MVVHSAPRPQVGADVAVGNAKFPVGSTACSTSERQPKHTTG